MSDGARPMPPAPAQAPKTARWRAHVPLALGALCSLGWLAALALGLAVSPMAGWVVWARLALLVGPSWLVLLVGALRKRGMGIHGGRLALALGLALVGVGPTLLAPAHNPTGIWLSLAVVLPPGFSAGIALGYVWGTPANREYRPPLGRADRNAVLRGAIGFALPPLALIVLVVGALLFGQPTCSGYGCMLGAVFITFFVVGVGIATVFAMVLVLLGGVLGSALCGG